MTLPVMLNRGDKSLVFVIITNALKVNFIILSYLLDIVSSASIKMK